MYGQQESRGQGHGRGRANDRKQNGGHRDTYNSQSHTPNLATQQHHRGNELASATNYFSSPSQYGPGFQPPSNNQAYPGLYIPATSLAPPAPGPVQPSFYVVPAASFAPPLPESAQYDAQGCYVQQQVPNEYQQSQTDSYGYPGFSIDPQVRPQMFALPIRSAEHELPHVRRADPPKTQNYYGSLPAARSSLATPAYPTNMSYPYDNSQYSYAPGASNPYAQQAQQSYDQAPPSIRNPFPAPPPAHSAYSAHNAGYDPEQEALMAQWQSQYAPVDAQASKDSRGKPENPNTAPVGPRPGAAAAPDVKTGDPDKKVTVVRKGGGQTWEDNSLLEWDPTQFRIMVGNLAGEVTDDSLSKAFAQYGVSKARVIRDKRTTKSKGFGFVSFFDGELGFKAAREMVGKYIGSHPVTIQRSKTDLKPVAQKDKYKGKGKNNKNNRNDKKEKKQDDPLRAHTGAVIEKKPVKNPGGYKVIG